MGRALNGRGARCPKSKRMNTPIDDKFKNAKTLNGKRMSKQQRHANRRRAKGLCISCCEPAEPSARKGKEGTFGPYCTHHKIENRERARKRAKCRRRWKGASSYGGEK